MYFCYRIQLHPHILIISANVEKQIRLFNYAYMLWDSWYTEETDSEPFTGVGVLSDCKLV